MTYGQMIIINGKLLLIIKIGVEHFRQDQDHGVCQADGGLGVKTVAESGQESPIQIERIVASISTASSAGSG